MIKLHFRKIEGEQYCHLYSDTGNIEELKEWLKEHGIKKYNKWIQKDKFPHVDLYKSGLEMLYNYHISGNREFKRDMDTYKSNKDVSLNKQLTIGGEKK